MSRRDPLKVTPQKVARAQRWPIGQPVTVRKDDGSEVSTTTRSAPWRLGGTWVILVHGIAGGYALARVTDPSEAQP